MLCIACCILHIAYCMVCGMVCGMWCVVGTRALCSLLSALCSRSRKSAAAVNYLPTYLLDLHSSITQSTIHPPPSLSPHSDLSHAPRPRRLWVTLQIQQDLTHALLSAAFTATPLTLAAKIGQLGDALPTRAAGGGVLAVLDEVGGLAACLGLLLVRLAVVGFVELVDVAARLGDRLGFLFRRGGVASGEVGVAGFAPFSGREA